MFHNTTNLQFLACGIWKEVNIVNGQHKQNNCVLQINKHVSVVS